MAAFRLARILSASLLAFIAFASSTSCGRTPQANTAHFPYAHVQEGCGPADGLALALYLTAKPARYEKYEEPFLMIQIIANLPKSAPHDYAIGASSRDMLASLCQSAGHCMAATSGTLHLTKFTQGKNVSGEYELHFQNGSIEKGQFDAAWCVVHFMCG